MLLLAIGKSRSGTGINNFGHRFASIFKLYDPRELEILGVRLILKNRSRYCNSHSRNRFTLTYSQNIANQSLITNG